LIGKWKEVSVVRPRIYRQAVNIHKVVGASRRMLCETGREPTPEEPAERLGMSLQNVRTALKVIKESILLENPYA
jgi:DNA-directed RNA polymerase sigma subunit (sigma70/sigma32)